MPDYPSSKSSICYGPCTFKSPAVNALKRLWDQVLQYFRMTGVSLQSSDRTLNTGLALYESLHGYIQAMWYTLLDIEQKAKDLTKCGDYQQQTQREHKRNHEYDISAVLVLLIHLLNLKCLLRSLKAKQFLSLLIACFLPCQNARKLIKR